MKNIEYYPTYNSDVLNEFELVKSFNKNNVIVERVDLYQDFTINLLNYIYDTYLGNEYIYTDKDIEGHYNWCFRKTIEEFAEEEIDFHDNDELYRYFFGYYYDQFYTQTKIQSLPYYENFWKDIFEYKKMNKSKDSLSVLLELYQTFDKSLFNKNNQKELI